MWRKVIFFVMCTKRAYAEALIFWLIIPLALPLKRKEIGVGLTKQLKTRFKGIVRHFGKFAYHYYQYRQWVQVIKGIFFNQCLLYCFITCPQECFGVFWGRETWTFHRHCVSLSSWHLCPIPQQTIKEKYLLICPCGLWQLMNLPKMLNYPFKGLTTQLLVTRRWHFLETEWSTFCGAFSSCD